jgi:hypothetical protein
MPSDIWRELRASYNVVRIRLFIGLLEGAAMIELGILWLLSLAFVIECYAGAMSGDSLADDVLDRDVEQPPQKGTPGQSDGRGS